MGIGLPEVIVLLLISVWRVLPLVILIFAYRRLGQAQARIDAVEERLSAIELRELRAMAGRREIG
ncbi:MAG: hypothetical protein U0470_13155 [Anaerolineae bacterium]